MEPVRVKWMWGDNISVFPSITWLRAGSDWLELHELKAALAKETNRQREVRMKVCWGQSEQEFGPKKLEEAWEYLVGEVVEGVNDTSVTMLNARKLSEHHCFKLKLLGRLRRHAELFLMEVDGRPELWKEGKLADRVQERVTAIVRDHRVTSYKVEFTAEAVELHGLAEMEVADVLAAHVEAGLLVIREDGEDEMWLVNESEAGLYY